jgi:fibronectin type 3 domain-containing protein
VRDITPPGPPTGLAVVPREGGLDVVWSPSPARDIGGYRIYRAAGEEDAVVVAEVQAGETSWHDAQVAAGVLYRYTITALDRAGNEGPASGSAEGRPD